MLAPNIWAPAVEIYDATVRGGMPPDPAAIPLATARMDAALPERLTLFPAGPGRQSGPAELEWPTLLGQVALTLQSRARPPATTFLRVAAAGQPGLFRLILEAHDPVLAEACLTEAIALLAQSLAGDLEPLGPLHERLMHLADDVCVGPGTMLLVQAAVARGLPWRRLGRECLVQLGQGARQRRLWTAVTDRTSSIAEGIAVDKQLARELLAAAGVPVPTGRMVSSAAEAWEAAEAIGPPVVVKPADGNHGRGVFLNLSTREEVERAFPVALREGRRLQTVVVERFVPGVEHRLLVIGGRMVACAKGEHLHVTGDGRHTIAELVELQVNSDPRRGRSAAMPNRTVDLDDTVLAQLAQEGVTPASVPAAGRRVLVKRSGTHGLDVTAEVHPEMAATAVRAARVVGLDIAGIDLIARDIGRPPDEQGAVVCEVNAGPQLMIHARPSEGPGQPVAEAVMDLLCATGAPGRIPIVAIVAETVSAAAGQDSPTTRAAVRAEELLRAAGRKPGLSCAAGTWMAGRRCSAEPAVTVDAARDLLVSPEIDVAIWELDWRSLAARGFPVDRCDVLVLGRLPAEEPSRADAAVGVSPLAVVSGLIDTVAPTGTIVLGAADGVVADRAARSGRSVLAVERPADPATVAAAIATAVGAGALPHTARSAG